MVNYAIVSGVAISLLTFKGENANIKVIGKLAHKTNGLVT